MTATTSTTSRKGAVKGTVAAAAGVAVLLGGMGTFALWNVDGAIGVGQTRTGTLTATFGDAVAWEDLTTGAANPIEDVAAFRMVPGDVVVGTTSVTVTATGENLLVDAGLDVGEGALPADVAATVVLTDDDAGSAPVTTLQGTNAGKVYHLTAEVRLEFDEDATGSADAPIDLAGVKVDLQQRLNA